jgi:transglutaminase-like putative cysteine protease
MDWRVAALGAALFVGVVGVSALLFLVIPRFQFENSMFLDRVISKKAKSGFSDTVRFGDVTEIQQDNSVAFSVDVSDHAQIPATPYWRMLVLDEYENGTFRFSRALKNEELQLERTAANQRGYARLRGRDRVQWTFYLESGVSRYLPNLGHFEVLQFHEAQNFRFAPRLAMVALRDDPVSMTAYRIDGFDVSPALADPRFAAVWKAREQPAERPILLQTTLPAFAQERDGVTLRRGLTAATGGETALPAAEFARRVSTWLKAHHNYSLSPTIPPGAGDPLVKWLVSREAGHCELFAGSFVLLARAAGFPARLVTGFRGGSWNGYSNNFTVRNSDAHAWAEIFDEQTGAWLRADPLAAGAAMQAETEQGAAAIALRLDRSWKARFDSLRVFWYRRIVNFDQRSQAETMKAVKEATQTSGRRLRESLRESLTSIKAWLTAPWDLGRVASVSGAVVVIALATWIWREFGGGWWRGLRPGRGARRDDPVRREAGRWLRKFEGCDPRSTDCAAVMSELQRLRFGARTSWPPSEKVFRRARRVWREARRHYPPLRRPVDRRKSDNLVP